jgi:hypothetical protein
MIQNKKGAELERLVSAHRPHAGDDAWLSYYDAVASVLLKRPDRAVPLIQKAYLAAPDERLRGQFVTGFADAMREAGSALEAYRASPDRRAAFASLARHLANAKGEKQLRLLLAEHEKSHSTDPHYLYYTGEACLLEGDLAGAERHLRAARGVAGPTGEWMVRNALVRVLVKAGKAAEAYRELGQGERTFEELASRCVSEKNAGQLEALLSAHQKRGRKTRTCARGSWTSVGCAVITRGLCGGWTRAARACSARAFAGSLTRCECAAWSG